MASLLIPEHVAIIMDGNGRWAIERNLPRYKGHHRGIYAMREVVLAAGEIGIKNLTLFALSRDNWRRPDSEILELVKLIKGFSQKGLETCEKNNVKVRIIGERTSLDEDIVLLLKDAEERTRFNTGLKLFLAFNYGSRDEIVRAVKGLSQDIEAGIMCSRDITPSLISARLDTANVPDPDLIIRTGGEERLSDFLLWQAAYSEFVFMPEYWPDFSRKLFFSAVEQYGLRDRRFGGLSKKRRELVECPGN
ncbi:polyprenyl diphosphate synthase [Candidatus Liberibacter sp.]|uniref:polyprenyl diphosphate synthase n=1 Tax=Candidatus Liberibacter sp. TaxID=34022 RepID=UPI0015F75393|nr:polyprenyl diphosphate synthase [Candidatus Liberibacter sp.]MBA5724454.1 di-trans,poly-cis-decaprenylcistransferase [Candidatus Liberibacter sp.]